MEKVIENKIKIGDIVFHRETHEHMPGVVLHFDLFDVQIKWLNKSECQSYKQSECNDLFVVLNESEEQHIGHIIESWYRRRNREKIMEHDPDIFETIKLGGEEKFRHCMVWKGGQHDKMFWIESEIKQLSYNDTQELLAMLTRNEIRHMADKNNPYALHSSYYFKSEQNGTKAG